MEDVQRKTKLLRAPSTIHVSMAKQRKGRMEKLRGASSVGAKPSLYGFGLRRGQFQAFEATRLTRLIPGLLPRTSLVLVLGDPSTSCTILEIHADRSCAAGSALSLGQPLHESEPPHPRYHATCYPIARVRGNQLFFVIAVQTRWPIASATTAAAVAGWSVSRPQRPPLLGGTFPLVLGYSAHAHAQIQ